MSDDEASFYNFDIIIGDAPAKSKRPRYPVTAMYEGKTATCTFRYSSTQNEWQQYIELLGNFEKPLGNSLMTKIGSRLFNELVRDAIRDLWVAAQDAPDGDNSKKLRIRLAIHASEVACLPWESLCNAERNEVFAISQAHSLVRIENRHRYVVNSQNIEASLPLKILLVVPDDPNGLINAEKEINSIHYICNKLGSAYVKVTVLQGRCTIGVLKETIRSEHADIVHIITHGTTEGLLFWKNESEDWFVPARSLRVIIETAHTVKLVCINACLAGQSSPIGSFTSVASQLVQCGIPAIIAMQFRIIDGVATDFARYFYTTLLKGDISGNLEIAMSDARSTLYAENPEDFSFGTPILWLNAKHGAIFSMSEENPSRNKVEDKIVEDSLKSIENAASHDISSKKEPLSAQDQPKVVHTGGGIFINGNVTVNGDFTGRDQLTLNQIKSDEKSIAEIKDKFEPLAGETFNTQNKGDWLRLWTYQRSSESLRVQQWLDKIGLTVSPFGPQDSRLDPLLSVYAFTPPNFDYLIRGARSTVLFGTLGSGKTTLAFLLANDCQDPMVNPREEDTFPIYCHLTPAKLNKETIHSPLELVINELGETLIRYFSAFPERFLELTGSILSSSLTCMVNSTGSLETVRVRLTNSGIEAIEINRRLARMQSNLQLINLENKKSEAFWQQILYEIRLPTFKQMYFVVDVDSGDLLLTDRQTQYFEILNQLLRHATILARLNIYLKLFLPVECQNHLNLPVDMYPETLVWVNNQLEDLVESRLQSMNYFDFNQLFDVNSRVRQPLQKLIEAANGSPRKLIELGNRLIRQHAAQYADQFDPDHIELNYDELESLIAEYK